MLGGGTLWAMVRGLMVLVLLVAAAARAGAQTEYRLDDQGTWVKAWEPKPGTDEAFIADARALLAEGKFSEARRMLTKWIDEHQFTDNKWLPDAYLLRGDARQGAGEEYLALYDYKKVTTDFPATTAFITAIERELAISIQYLNGKKRRFLGIRWYNAESDAEELLVRIQQQVPRSILAERAGYELIRYYFRTRDLKMASEMSYIFMQNFPRSRYRGKVLEYRILSTWGLYAGPQYDGAYLIEARELIRQYMAEFPADAERTGINDAAIARIDESAAEQILETAKWYLRRGEAASARYTLKRLVRAQPLSVAASRAYDLLVEKGWTAGTAAPGPKEEPTGGEPKEPESRPVGSGG